MGLSKPKFLELALRLEVTFPLILWLDDIVYLGVIYTNRHIEQPVVHSLICLPAFMSTKYAAASFSVK